MDFINNIFKTIFGWFDPYTAIVIGTVKAVIIAVAVMSVVPALVWLERRLLGRFQVRLGPNRVGPFGLGQSFADSIKLLFKESIVQSSADKFLFHLAPAIVVFTSIVTFSVIPFGEAFELGGQQVGLWGANTNIGLLLFLAMSSMGIYGVVMAGLSSNNKYSLMGGLRSSAQMISYELTLGLAALSMVILTGTLNLVDIVKFQETIPGIIMNPLGFLLFFVAGIAETNRAPFDLPEAEQELVAGFFTEYSGMKFAMFFMGEYINMITMSALITILFLGGWHSYVFFDIPIIIFAGKVFLLLCTFIWIRATFPRIRYDRLMTFGWKFLLPLAMFNMIAYGFLKVIFLPDLIVRGDDMIQAVINGAKNLLIGMGVTFRNMVSKPTTFCYPEVKREMPARYRGRHFLNRDENGLERCIGCSLCSVNCPVGCIHVVASENDPANPVSAGERYASTYEINLLRCIYCGYCEEACPVDAVVLREHYELADYDRKTYIAEKNDLLVYPEPNQFRVNFLGNTTNTTVTKE